MPETTYVLLVPGKQGEKFKTMDEAAKAAKEFLRASPQTDKIAIHELVDNQLGKKGRMIFKVGDIFHYVDTEWLP